MDNYYITGNGQPRQMSETRRPVSPQVATIRWVAGSTPSLAREHDVIAS